jgi:hypothetical protein
VILRGTGDDWEQIHQTETEDDLWGMEWFQDNLYVASEDTVYRLEITGDLTSVTDGVLDYCGHLHANDGVMWSFGTKQVAWTDDVQNWHDVTP